MKGLQYYQAETSRFRDVKVRKLMKRHGSSGYGIYAYLLNECYLNGYFIKWDKDSPFLAADDLYTDESEINSVVSYCVEIELFDADMYAKGIITSRSIQIRYAEICKSLRRKVEITEYWLLNSTDKAQECKVSKDKEQECSLSEDNQQECNLSLNTEHDCKNNCNDVGYRVIKEKENKINNNTYLHTYSVCDEKKLETETLTPEDWINTHTTALTNDENWLLDISNDPLMGLTRGAADEVREKLTQFAREKISDKLETIYDKRSDYVKHFKAWLRLNKRVNDEHKRIETKQTSSTNYDKRRGTETGTAKPEDYHTSF